MLASSSIPVMIVEAASGRIEECNPAAAGIFRDRRDRLLGSQFAQSFAGEAVRAVAGWLDDARCSGSVEVRNALTVGGALVHLRLSLCRTPAAAFLLIHPTAAAAPAPGAIGRPDVSPAMHDAPIGFVVTDANFRVEYANRAFLRMIHSGAQAAVWGQPVGRWLRMTAEHWARLGLLLSGCSALEELSTVLKCRRGAECGVRVTAVAVPQGTETRWGFCVRDLAQFH